MNRAEIIHRAALIYVDTMSKEEVTAHVYKSAVISMEKLDPRTKTHTRNPNSLYLGHHDHILSPSSLLPINFPVKHV